MNKRIQRVVNGYMSLDANEQKEALEEIEDHAAVRTDREKRDRCENFSRRSGIDLGPVGSGIGACRCCGK